MTREIPDPDVAPLGGDAQARAFAAARREVATLPAKAAVHADRSGRWFHMFCAPCDLRGQAAKDRALIQARADQHNREAHR